ncbi:hypothetical protein BRD18_02685 [Halobacteriales archaeon SW_7_71_33]|nr:MAG: hypothetical protein BRD18_02685 [Halobacteriales archaeon SW_7_71_33]
MSHARRQVGLAAVVVVVLAAGAAAVAAPGAWTWTWTGTTGATTAPEETSLSGPAAGTGAGAAPVTAGLDATNETPTRLGLGPGEPTSETARPTARLGTAVAVGDDELRVRFGRYRVRELLDSATTDAERRAAVRRVLGETRLAVDRLRDREVAAVRAYRDGATDRAGLFRRLAAVHLAAAEHRRTLSELQRRADGSLTFELETEIGTLDRRLSMFRSPVRERVADGAVADTGGEVGVSTTEEGLALEAVVDGAYVREVIRFDRYRGGDGESLDTTREVVDRLGVLYPYAFTASQRHSISLVERRLFVAEFPHPQGRVRVYLNRDTGEIYREVQRLELDQVHTRSAVDRTVESLRVTVDRVDGRDPTRIRVRDNLTDNPVEATVSVGNRTVGTTTEGDLWLVVGTTPVEMTVDTGDRTVNVTVGDTATQAQANGRVDVDD